MIQQALDNIRNAMPSDVNIVMTGYAFGPYGNSGSTCTNDKMQIM